ncbi:MAG TPA: cyclic nucleotide-binding domain-containing protein [Anaerolineales bacterium]|nr:cyclic nucleotide-binding domain-containing protein [Anaerolineales bacterium]
MNETYTYDKVALLRLAFKGLDDKELEQVAALTEFRTYPADHVLCHEGAYEDVLYIVADGEFVVSQKMTGGKERILRVGGRGDVVGEMAPIQGAPRAATVRTTTECTVLEMEKDDFETILSRSPRMAIDLIRITLDRIRANDQAMIADLQKTNKILRQLDRNKLEFIQIAAHELRTPLTVLSGYVKVLQSFPETKTNPALGDVTEGILKGTDRIHEVVNMMLDLTRIGSEALKVASVPVPLRRIIDDLIRSFRKATTERNIQLTAHYAQGTPVIQGDPALIDKALYHLVINAIKYTPDGGKVLITTRPTLMDNHTPCVEIAVKDWGIGLDAEHHELIFEKFYQVGDVALHSSGKTTFKGGGPGLGLALVRGVAHAHGGKVWVESIGHDEVNFTGSTFYLQLPLAPNPLVE